MINSIDASSPSRRVLSPGGFRLLLAVLYTAHVGLVLLFCPPSVIFGERHLGAQDYQTHFQQTHTVEQVMERFGKTWAYDPNMLAGFPVGLFFDVDNKGHSLFAIGMTRIGLSLAQGYNLFTLVSCLLAPLCVLLAARLLRMTRGAQVLALALGILLWQFDSGPRFAWSAGMVSFGTVSHGHLLALALLHRVIEDGRWRWVAPAAAVLALLLLIHVWAFVILVMPLTGMYLRRARRLGPAGHARVWCVALVALGCNLYWLWPALHHLDLLSPSARLGQATPLYIWSDYLGVVVDPLTTGFILQHTFFRFLAVAAAVVTLWQWRRRRDDRFFVGALGLGWMMGLTYVAALIPVLEHTEPYRFIAPATFMAGLLAAPWLARTLAELRWRRLSFAARSLMVVLLILAASRGLREVVYYLPALMPGLKATATAPGPAEATAKSSIGGGPFRLFPVVDAYVDLADKMKKSCTEDGRILVQEWPVAEYLRAALDRPVIGGFPDRRTIHEDANIFLRPGDRRLFGRKLANYLVQYNVRYLVMSGLYNPILESRKDLLERPQLSGLFRIYRVRHFGTYVAGGGTGSVKASLNRIAVTGASPRPGSEALVLRFHHFRNLRCHPACKVERASTEGDRAGFIKVVGQPKLPEKFVIEHRY